MKKLAGDANHRIFQALPDHQKDDSFNKMLDKNSLLQCFLKGESKSNWGKAVKNRKVDVGREIKVQIKNQEKKLVTAHIFEKPSCLWKKDGKYWFTTELVPASKKYLFRHAFEFEKEFCLEPLGFDDRNLRTFVTFDKYNIAL